MAAVVVNAGQAYNAALKRMESRDVFGKILLRVS